MAMRTMFRSLAVAAALLAGAHEARARLLIDDFADGAYRVDLAGGDEDRNVQRGSMIGGRRFTFFRNVATRAALNPYDQLATLDIVPGGVAGLTMSADVLVFHGLQVFYGHPEGGLLGLVPLPPLNVDLTDYDRFRVTFDASDVGLNFNMQMLTANNPAPHQLGINVPGRTLPFCIDFPFRSFVRGAGPPPDLEHVNQIRLLLQSGSAVGSNDYVVSSVEATSGGGSCVVAANQ